MGLSVEAYINYACTCRIYMHIVFHWIHRSLTDFSGLMLPLSTHMHTHTHTHTYTHTTSPPHTTYRHPSNLMLDRLTGRILHIDFGDCFEVAMTREKFPEKIPFRLTRMLTNAMEVHDYHRYMYTVYCALQQLCNPQTVLYPMIVFVVLCVFTLELWITTT